MADDERQDQTDERSSDDQGSDAPGESIGGAVRQLGPAAVLAVAAAVLPALGGFILLGSVGIVGPWLDARGWAGLLIYAGVFAATSGLALLPTYAQSFVGGWAFGLYQGTPAALVGFALGSVIGYEVAKPVAAERVTALIESKPKWRVIRDAFLGGAMDSDEPGSRPGFWRLLLLVTLVRLPPSSPFALTNMLLASVGVPRLIYVLGTIIGMAPRTAIVVWLGARLSGESLSGQDVGDSRPWWFWVANIGFAFVIILIFNHFAQRALDRAAKQGVLGDDA